MYESNSASVLKIGIFESGKRSVLFKDLFNDNIMGAITTHKNISLETNVINLENGSFSSYNFIFYVIHIDDIINAEIMNHIKTIGSQMTDGRNHLFIIVDGCNDMLFDDDGDLIFSDKSINSGFKKFVNNIDSAISSKLFDVCKLSIPMAKIFSQIIEDKSIVNLSVLDIDLLAQSYVKKSSQMSDSDKKSQLKIALKKLDIETKLSETGYTETLDTILKYFKIVCQKKIVCKNYLSVIENCPIDMTSASTLNVQNILDEIFNISYLKSDMFDNLIERVQSSLSTKLSQFYDKNRAHIAIDSGLLKSIDAYAYHDFLLSYLEIDSIKTDRLPLVKKMIEAESEILNKMIVNHYNKEVGKIIDLDKISAAFKVFALKDKNNIPGLFEKMRSNPQIISENMGRMEAWVSFIDMCLKLGIKSEPIIDLIECIIIEKIKHNVDMTKTNRPDVSAIYPYCLLTFLLKNLSKGFVFDKLYMFLSCSIRYSGRNLPDLIQNLNAETYNSLLVLEHKLLELVNTQ